ncbi:MAG: MG2 domain-containing protein [Bacteroidales bacterium]|nr:MG2 domain-containing protein [Bacteroidales bacterium]
MKLKHIIPAAVLSLSLAGGYAVNKWTDTNPKTDIIMAITDNYDYKKAWEEVERYDSESLPKSALDKIREIRSHASHDQNYQQLIKTYIYSIDLVKETVDEKASDDERDKTFMDELRELESKAETFPEDYKALSYHILAKYYNCYLDGRRWSIQDRTALENDNNPDPETWTIDRFQKEITIRLRKSIANPEALIAKNIKDYDILIDAKYKNTISQMPTLYDYLAWHVVTKLETGNNGDFSFQSEELISDRQKFLNHKPDNEDTESDENQILGLMKEIIKQHAGDKEKNALAYADMKRLEYYKGHSTNEAANQIYLHTLESMLKEYGDCDYANTMINSKIAEQLIQMGRLKEAHDIAKDTYDKFPNSEYGKKCRGIYQGLEIREVNFDLEKYVGTQKKFPVLLKYRNVSKLYLKILKVNNQSDYEKSYRELDYLRKNSREVASYEYDLIDEKDYQEKSSEIIVNPLECGFYVMVAATSPKALDKNNDVIAWEEFNSTDISVVTSAENKDATTFYIVDRTSGDKLPFANVEILYQKKNLGSIKEENGCFKVEKSFVESKRYWDIDLKISSKDDKIIMPFPGSFSHSSHSQSGSVSQIFTDRKIYRPGQTIYWKLIRYTKTDNKAQAVKDYKTTLELRDINSQKVEEVEIVTNEFGSAHGQFQIPTGLANGSFEIVDTKNHFSTSVQVEEYKRPTFVVEVNNVKDEVKLNGPVTVTGSAKTYSGESVAGAKVRYEVIRIPKWRGWWFWGASESSRTIDFGETTTNDNGEFKIEFVVKPNMSDTPSEFLSYNYKVTFDVTDINGETRQGTGSVSAGYRSLFLNIGMASGLQIMEKTSLDSVTIYAENINGANAVADVTIKVSKLMNPDRPRIKKYWESCKNPIISRQEWDKAFDNLEYQQGDNEIDSLKVEKLIKTMTAHVDGQAKVNMDFLKSLGSGSYLIEISAKDKDNLPVRYEQRITLYSIKDKITTINQCILTSLDKASYQPGDVAHFTIASALKDLSVKCIISDGKNYKDIQTLKISASSKTIDIPITEEMRGGLSVQVIFVKHNHTFRDSKTISVPFSNKYLKINFEAFRDKLLPGEQEKWKIRITDYKNNPVIAEMMATLYDESLDALMGNYWSMGVYSSNYVSNYYNQHLFGSGSSNHETGKDNNASHYYIYQELPEMRWYNHYPSLGRRYGVVIRGIGSSTRGRAGLFDCVERAPMVMMESSVAMDCEEEAPMMMSKKAVVNSVMSVTADELEEETAEVDNGGADFDNVEVRSNFAETAFFQPQVVTDENGELYIEFTVPESITKWKMLGLAHTKDMCIGNTENHLVTKKDFSVQPNLPRFMRCGDEISIPVKINNLLEDQKISGQVRFEILNAETMKPVSDFNLKTAVQSFECEKGKSIVKKFAFKVPEYMEPVVIKVVGVAGNQSDGEQHILPILTDKQLVTESMTMSVRGGQTKNFEFKEWKYSDSKTAVNHSFTLEYSSNPAWYAVTSLPWLSENPYECYEQIFSKLFANSISGLIIENNPEIDKVINQWRENKSQVLTSPLLKNQELKTVLIEETPWAIEGKDENERIANLANLLDKKRIETENNKFIKKLEQGQLPNGAWPWFDGMRENPCITQYIVTNFGKMRNMGVKLDDRINTMIKKAMKYLDSEAVKYHQECMKWKSEPGSYGYQFMYMRTFWNEYKMDKKTQDAYNFFMDHAKRNWTKFYIANQALLCTTFKRSGNTDLAQKIMKSFNERAIRSEEFGMYFKENVNGILFHEQNIETQSLIIEAYQEMQKAEEVEELKIWLIKNRQANRWKTTKATTEAVYAMFLCGNKIKSDEPLCTITIGGNTVDQKDAELGTGYIKQQWTKDEMNINMADIKVENPNNHISYGAVYRQYFEKLDNIKAADNKLKIEKKIFRQSKDANGKDLLSEITEKTPIKPGDKVTVRFIITTDRDLEYVHLKDMRAAGFEPLNVISRTKYQDGMFYYESTKDASENFFIEHLNKGTYVFEYPLVAVHAGNFSVGIATIQCMYAPEFVSHSEGMRFSIAE